MRFRTDNAKKALRMRADLQTFRIFLTTASPHTSETNGMSESMNTVLLDKVRSMFKESNINHRYWRE